MKRHPYAEQSAALRAIWEQRRDTEGLNQTKIAKMIGVDAVTVNQYIRGAIPLNADAVLEFARVLRVSPGDSDYDIGKILGQKDPPLERYDALERELVEPFRTAPIRVKVFLMNLKSVP